MSCFQILTVGNQGLTPSKHQLKINFHNKAKQYSSRDSYYTTSPNVFRNPWFSDSCKKAKTWSRNEYKCQLLKPMSQMQNSGYLGYFDIKIWVLKIQIKYSNLNTEPKKKNIFIFHVACFFLLAAIYPIRTVL